MSNLLPSHEGQEHDWEPHDIGFVGIDGAFYRLNMSLIYGKTLTSYLESIRINCHAAFRDCFLWEDSNLRPHIECRCRNCWSVWAIRDMELFPNDITDSLMYPLYRY